MKKDMLSQHQRELINSIKNTTLNEVEKACYLFSFEKFCEDNRCQYCVFGHTDIQNTCLNLYIEYIEDNKK